MSVVQLLEKENKNLKEKKKKITQLCTNLEVFLEKIECNSEFTITWL